MATEKFREKICQIYSIAADLSEMFPGRKFTPDGHMVGSIGEAIAKIDYGVELFPNGHKDTDGIVGGREVQIKATQGTKVAVKKPRQGDLLLVIKINSDGSWEKIYDGDFERVWDALGRQQENKIQKKTISLQRLQELQTEVNKNDRILPKTSTI